MPCSCSGENDCLHPEACEYFRGLPSLRQQEASVPVQIKQQQQQQRNQQPLRPDFGDSGFDADEWRANE
jgi:hypothetical protein